MTEEMPEGAEIDNIYIENKALGIGHQPTKSFCSQQRSLKTTLTFYYSLVLRHQCF